MTTARDAGPREAVSANDDLRPKLGTGVPLHAVPIPATPAFNHRLRMLLASAA